MRFGAVPERLESGLLEWIVGGTRGPANKLGENAAERRFVVLFQTERRAVLAGTISGVMEKGNNKVVGGGDFEGGPGGVAVGYEVVFLREREGTCVGEKGKTYNVQLPTSKGWKSVGF